MTLSTPFYHFGTETRHLNADQQPESSQNGYAKMVNSLYSQVCFFTLCPVNGMSLSC